MSQITFTFLYPNLGVEAWEELLPPNTNTSLYVLHAIEKTLMKRTHGSNIFALIISSTYHILGSMTLGIGSPTY